MDLSGVWSYDTSEVIADPGAGKLRTVGTPATRAVISTTRQDASDAGAELRALVAFSTLLFQQKSDATIAVEYVLTSDALDHGSWVEFAVEKQAASAGTTGEPTKNTDLLLIGTLPEVSDAGIEFLPDDLPPEDAAEYVSTARMILEAALYPNTLPPDPLPAPLEIALAAVAYDVWQLDVASEANGGRRIVSESRGAYSYRLESPTGADVFTLSDKVLGLIEPWLPSGAGGVYQLDVGRSLTVWPEDWWQRDLDNPLKAEDAEELAK